jgi:hypothetical protein
MGLFTKEEKKPSFKCPACKYEMISPDDSTDSGYICKNRNCVYWGIFRYYQE